MLRLCLRAKSTLQRIAELSDCQLLNRDPKPTIEMAACKSLMAHVLAIDSSITRGLRAGRRRRRPPRLKQSPSRRGEMKPVSSGYADGNGIKLYREIYVEGKPWC